MKHAFILVVAILMAFSTHAAPPKPGPCILFDTSYGAKLPGSTKDVALWSASSGWKVAKTRPVPGKTAKALEVSLAGNERDAVQLVVHPQKELANLTLTVSPLKNEAGAVFDAANVELLRVRYVDIKQQSDAWGALAPWPDPLPPINGLLTLKAGENQPFWLRVHAPKNTPAGCYTGAVHLQADGFSADVPLHVHVYGFELPDRMTCETAFGFSAENVWRYQGITDPQQRRAVLDKYWAALSAHHISPYHPEYDAVPEVQWRTLGPDGGAGIPEADRRLLQQHPLTPVIDWTRWDAELKRVFDTYHFQTFRLAIPGISGGEYQGFKEGTRERDLAFANYCRAVQEHLRQQGMLDAAYVYWTDEPTRDAYPHVMAGFKRLKDAAPDIRRMLTEQVEPELVGGPNLWCPITILYKHEETLERRQAGDQFWWYVCTGPKQPLCGLFIDHAAVDLRTWLWQTWRHDITGVLIWQTNLWTTNCAYPDTPQNPYEDPMSWMTGYGTKPGQKRPWGNGDGRFLYPPEAAANANPPAPVLDGPVDSIRFEMLRDGIEDYEYLAILKRLLEEKRATLPKGKLRKFESLLAVPKSIFVDLRNFNKDPAPIEKRRDQIARAIEQINRQ